MLLELFHQLMAKKVFIGPFLGKETEEAHPV